MNSPLPMDIIQHIGLYDRRLCVKNNRLYIINRIEVKRIKRLKLLLLRKFYSKISAIYEKRFYYWYIKRWTVCSGQCELYCTIYHG